MRKLGIELATMCKDCPYSVEIGEDYLYCPVREGNVQHFDPVCDNFEELKRMTIDVNGEEDITLTMDRCGVNEYYLDDDYSNTTCDCRFCKENKTKRDSTVSEEDIIEYASMEGLREAIRQAEEEYGECVNANTFDRVVNDFYEGDEDLSFDLVWDEKQKPEPPEDILDPLDEADRRALLLLEAYGESYTPEEKRRVAEYKAEMAEEYCEGCQDMYHKCEECCCDQDSLADFAEFVEEEEVLKLMMNDLESAFVDVVYAVETERPKREQLEKIQYLQDLLDVLKFLPMH